MTLQLPYGYSAGLVDGIKAAWGARWIVTQDGTVDFVHDRQGVAGDPDLETWIDKELRDQYWWYLDLERPEWEVR